MFRRILVGFDGSSTSGAALAAALALATPCEATLRVVNVVERLPNVIGLGGGLDRPPAQQERMRAEADSALGRAAVLMELSGVRGDTLALEADEQRVASVLQAAAQEWAADLIVLGTHGRRGAQRLMLGSVAEAIVRSSIVPVMVVPRHEPGR